MLTCLLRSFPFIPPAPERQPYREKEYANRRMGSFGSPERRSSQPPPEHVCALCGKARSADYQERHPLRPSEIPEPGICSRSKCVRAVKDMLLAEPFYTGVVVYEFHHYHHMSPGLETFNQTGSVPELSGGSSSVGRAELLGKPRYIPYSESYRSTRLSPVPEQPPPPFVQTSTKPAIQRSFT